MDPCALRARLGRMEDLGQIAAVVVACGTALVFALMAWAGQRIRADRAGRSGKAAARPGPALPLCARSGGLSGNLVVRDVGLTSEALSL